MVEVKLPQLGETVTEGTILAIRTRVGDVVAVDELLFEISTDKVDAEVTSPAAGRVAEILVREGETVAVGSVLARVAEGAVAGAAASPTHRGERGGRRLSPVVRRLLAEHSLDASELRGSGGEGRITRADVLAAIAARTAGAPRAVNEFVGQKLADSGFAAAPERASRATRAPLPPAPELAPGETVESMNRIRRSTAEHMLRSKATAPHVLTAVEVDFEGVERVRRAERAAWREREGVSLTYLPFIAHALCGVLREFPRINATVRGNDLVLHPRVNLAIAVDLDFEGLLAPVIPGAEQLPLRAIAREIVAVAERARARKLRADEVQGGTITITNPGGYGTLMQFPIINQPQVAILSTDGIRRRPVVVTDASGGESIAIHSVGVLALAWDHRAFDGAYAAAFLAALRELIETRDWAAEID